MKATFLLLTCLLSTIWITSAAYDEGLALDLLYVSGLAYCNSTRIIEGQWGLATKMTQSLGMEVLHAADNNLTANGITYTILKRSSKKQLIVAFSGTRAIEQLITEIGEAFWWSYDIHPQIQGAKVFDYFYSYYLSGFRADFCAYIQEYLKTYSGYSVVFTGHSLGGAMTIHAAADFMLSGWGQNRNVLIYTYGQPRVGNPAFTDSFIPQTNGYYRLVHYKDIVAHIPPCLPGITTYWVHDGPLPFYPYHSPQEIFYDEGFGNFTECSTTNGEDANWSLSVLNDSIPDHLYYFNLNVGELGGVTESYEKVSI